MKHSLIQKYKKISLALSEFSSCDNAVGALVLKDGRICATGYNGQLPGAPHTELVMGAHGSHDVSTVHAEQNCIYFMARHGISTKECVMLTTHSPCQICTKMLVMCGFSKVYYMHRYRWKDNPFTESIEMVRI